MAVFEIIITCLSLTIDVFTISMYFGLTHKEEFFKTLICCCAWFCVFQSVYFVVGYLLASLCFSFISRIDHYIIFVLLEYMGISSIIESKTNKKIVNTSLKAKNMLFLAISVSLDSLVVGASWVGLEQGVFALTLLIFAFTLIMTFLGVIIGNSIKQKLKSKAKCFSGVLLILIGIAILIYHII